MKIFVPSQKQEPARPELPIATRYGMDLPKVEGRPGRTRFGRGA